ncbi:protein-disulfide reductase DsbD family protein [Cognatishimia sp. SS12]|uniref:protein-disulfide reductase DsbD domain-containing protein n=1 Tax=Cognatishimia sp. SS12 TaxID=2979465 RepID=UPI00232BC3CA|nr:protein-disulfide reductase DsbD domain-containing protein [Cognatishimia sp. SS12]MDC0739094.1 protein-disulfide reductase DsbD family protein [Cognatishimia sp. SS12]
MLKHCILAGLAALSLIVPQRAALAQLLEQPAHADILPGWRQADGTHVAALRIVLKDGWKTYWRAPGDGGIPPRFNWSGSRNLKALQPIWPAPSVFLQNGLRSVGYERELLLPFAIAPRRAGADIKLSGTLEIGVCKDVCIPETLKVVAVLPGTATEVDPRIAAALAAQPYSAQEAGVSTVECHMDATPDGIRLSATIQMPDAGREFAVIETDNPELWVAEAALARRGATLSVSSEIIHVENDPFLLNRDGVRITVLGSKYSVDIKGCRAG